MKSFIASVVLALGIVVPSFAFAQTSGTGTVDVYVQVINGQNSTCYSQTYPYTSCSTASPSDFTVTVAGQNPSITNFQGSTSGTLVSLSNGSYNVYVNGNQNGYTPSYSTGCQSTISGGQSQTCVITMSLQNSSNNYYPYLPYNSYVPPALTCAPSYQTVDAGQEAQFTAEGGQGGTYNWETPQQNYPNVGPVLTVTFPNTGSQLVTVTNANETATCSINVTATQGYYPNPTPIYTQPSYTVVPSTPNYTYTVYPSGYSSSYPTSYPTWPNTGFAPYGGSAGALALLALAAVALVAAPYVRKAFVAVIK